VLSINSVENRSHLLHDMHNPEKRKYPFVPNQTVKINTLHITHSDPQNPVMIPHPIDRDDIGMIERGRSVGLPNEPVPKPHFLRDLQNEELENHLASGEGLNSQVHHAHAAPAEQELDGVSGDLRPDVSVLAH